MCGYARAREGYSRDAEEGGMRYIRPELNIKIIRSAAKMMLSAGGNQDRGIRAYRDLLITTVRLRRRNIEEEKCLQRSK